MAALQKQSINIKTCTKCKTLKDSNLFSKSCRTKDGRNGWCKSCLGPFISNWQKENKQANREKLLKHRYGINAAQYQEMFADQNGRCAICKKHQSELKRSLSVDHDHKTKAIRELLCDLCNRAIGYLKEDTGLLKSAISYLEKHHGS